MFPTKHICVDVKVYCTIRPDIVSNIKLQETLCKSLTIDTAELSVKMIFIIELNL